MSVLSRNQFLSSTFFNSPPIFIASNSFTASTYCAIPSATCLASRMASTTVDGRFTTSPPANTPLRVVIPYGFSRVNT